MKTRSTVVLASAAVAVIAAVGTIVAVGAFRHEGKRADVGFDAKSRAEGLSAASGDLPGGVDPDVSGSPVSPDHADPAAGADLAATVTIGSLKQGTKLTSGHVVKSPNGKYTLAQQADGNLVVLDAAGKTMWSTQTGGNTGAYTVFQTDGNLVTYSSSAKPLWHTATTGTGKTLLMQDDGNAVIYATGTHAVWCSKIEVNSIWPGQFLAAKQTRASYNGKYRLTQQADGDLVVTGPGAAVLWSAQTGGNPGAYAALNFDGNLVVYSKDKKALWSSATSGNKGAIAVMQDDGNLVISTPENKPLWGALSHGIDKLTAGQTLRPGQSRRSWNSKFTLAMQTDGNLTLRNTANAVVWQTNTGQNPGATVQLQADGNLVLRSASGALLWNSATGGTNAAYMVIALDGKLVLCSLANAPLKSLN